MDKIGNWVKPDPNQIFNSCLFQIGWILFTGSIGWIGATMTGIDPFGLAQSFSQFNPNLVWFVTSAAIGLIIIIAFGFLKRLWEHQKRASIGQNSKNDKITLNGVSRENGQYISIRVHNDSTKSSILCTPILSKVIWLKHNPKEKTKWIDITDKISSSKRFLSWDGGSKDPMLEILSEESDTINVAKFNSSSGLIDFTLFSGDKPHWAGQFKIWVNVHWKSISANNSNGIEKVVFCVETVPSSKSGYVYELDVIDCEESANDKQKTN